jgi:hypothetical protein
MPPILDVAIGLVFVFLIFSLVISALNELVMSFFHQRSAFLAEALAELLADPRQVSGGPLEKLLNHGLVDALSRDAKGKTGKPAYLPPKVFVVALLDQISAAKVGVNRTMADINAGLAAMPEGKLKQSLVAHATEAGQDLEKFKAALETWFNQSMARVSGWYKRYAQQWLFVFGLTLALVGNIDSIRIIQSLSKDPVLRNSLVDQGVAFYRAHAPDLAIGDTNVVPAAAASKPGVARTDALGVSATQLTNSVNQLATLLPVGWDPEQLKAVRDGGRVSILMTLCGCLITALAGSLGAPFWFDTLNRFINIRGSGRAPEEGDPTNPKPKAAS